MDLANRTATAFVHLLGGHPDDVGRHAQLAAVHRLPTAIALGRVADVSAASDQHRALAASSSVTGTRFSAAAFITRLPTSIEPVNTR